MELPENVFTKEGPAIAVLFATVMPSFKLGLT
ncbi:Protein of unknown function [Lactobacillus helveticus CIRM-BIA 953]|uniref:Uncharacterized protein n=1 Tax=Lactobacillus helveticus CIRM-BIA 953 TaxID=1226335 RepID=U4QMX3_LACHE|nr:Protein of unknown function [Lactobacillus helveticus CIRM-BIA 953]